MKRFIRCAFFLAAVGCVVNVSHAERTDVLVIVNENSIDSPQVGAHYASVRGVPDKHIVRVKTPNQYFISWSDFLSLRDQILRFGVCRSIDDVSLRPAACNNSSLPMYTAANIEQLVAATPIKYIVTTRGVPTRVSVDVAALTSPASFGGEPASVDNFLKFVLARYQEKIDLSTFNTYARAVDFSDGRSMRVVEPRSDFEFIIGRIDGLDVESAKALVDRAATAELQGVYGNVYTSEFVPGIATNGNAVSGASYILGLFSESQTECINLSYLGFAQASASGKSPSHCKVQFTRQGKSPNDTMPGVAVSRQPLPSNALAYLGDLDGQGVVGGFNTLLNWKKSAACEPALCSAAQDPQACRMVSTDPFREINTSCVGVNTGFFGFNHQSWPVAYFGSWPTGWQTSQRGPEKSDVPFVDTTRGNGDSFSMWYASTDEVAAPVCYRSSQGLLNQVAMPCVSERNVEFEQIASLAAQAGSAPATYRLRYDYKAESVANTNPEIRILLEVSYPKPAGQGCVQNYIPISDNALCAYSDSGKAIQINLESGVWESVVHDFAIPPGNGAALSARIRFKSYLSGGQLGFDNVSFKNLLIEEEKIVNGSFSGGHLQAAFGAFASDFLSRLGGTAFWGSLSHFESSGNSFSLGAGDTPIYLMRGLPLGDAVWLRDNHLSGVLYGDPLYSPAAVYIEPLGNPWGMATGVTALSGSALNGSGQQTVTSYKIDSCRGRDFSVCDRQGGWVATGISQSGKVINGSLGNLNTTNLIPGDHTLRLSVTSTFNGVSKTISDYYPIRIFNSTSDYDGDGLTDVSEMNSYGTSPVNVDSDSDNLSDGDEVNVTLTDPAISRSANPEILDGDLDPFGDGVGYAKKILCGLNVHESQSGVDTDLDGMSDAAECAVGRNLQFNEPKFIPQLLEVFE